MTAEFSWRISDELPRVTGVRMVIQFADRKNYVFEVHDPGDVEIKVDRVPSYGPGGFQPAVPDVISAMAGLGGEITTVALHMRAPRGGRISYDPQPGDLS